MKLITYTTFFIIFNVLIFIIIQCNITSNILIIIPSDIYYINIIRNFYITNIVRYNLSNIFRVVAYTKTMYEKCIKYNIPVEKMDKQIAEDNNSYKQNSINFIKKTRLKHPIIYKYLKIYKYILFLDADVYFFVNPLILFKYLKPESNLMMPCDNNKCTILNYGFLLIKKSKLTIRYFKELIKIEQSCKSYKWQNGEQGIANRYLKSISYIKVQKMKIDIFMDGFNFFKLFSFSLENKLSSLIGFHNDFTLGVDSKIFRLKELGLYKIDYNMQEIKSYQYLYYNGSTNVIYNETINILSHLIYLCKVLNRTLILPKFDCKFNRKCTFVELFNLECFSKCNIKYKENNIFNMIFEVFKNSYTYLTSYSSYYKKYKSNLLIIDKLSYQSFYKTNKCVIKDYFWQKSYNECSYVSDDLL